MSRGKVKRNKLFKQKPHHLRPGEKITSDLKPLRANLRIKYVPPCAQYNVNNFVRVQGMYSQQFRRFVAPMAFG